MALGGGTTSFSDPAVPAGTHTVVAVDEPADGDFLISTSTGLSQAVNAPPPSPVFFRSRN